MAASTDTFGNAPGHFALPALLALAERELVPLETRHLGQTAQSGEAVRAWQGADEQRQAEDERRDLHDRPAFAA